MERLTNFDNVAARRGRVFNDSSDFGQFGPTLATDHGGLKHFTHRQIQLVISGRYPSIHFPVDKYE